MVIGFANGWASPYLAQLTLSDSVSGIKKIGSIETSWIASLLNIGRIFGAILGALIQGTLNFLKKWF